MFLFNLFFCSILGMILVALLDHVIILFIQQNLWKDNGNINGYNESKAKPSCPKEENNNFQKEAQKTKNKFIA